MLPDDELVEGLTRDVFETILRRRPSRQASAPPSGTATYAVDIAGAWEGSVSLQVADGLAKRIACEMFESEEAAPDDVRDAMCELANVIGGNIKSLMPGPSQLSVPRVGPNEPAASGDKQLVFTCEGEAFSVTVHSTQNREPVHEDPHR
jgi:chemotaxis protein CheX